MAFGLRSEHRDTAAFEVPARSSKLEVRILLLVLYVGALHESINRWWLLRCNVYRADRYVGSYIWLLETCSNLNKSSSPPVRVVLRSNFYRDGPCAREALLAFSFTTASIWAVPFLLQTFIYPRGPDTNRPTRSLCTQQLTGSAMTSGA